MPATTHWLSVQNDSAPVFPGVVVAVGETSSETVSARASNNNVVCVWEDNPLTTFLGYPGERRGCVYARAPHVCPIYSHHVTEILTIERAEFCATLRHLSH